MTDLQKPDLSKPLTANELAIARLQLNHVLTNGGDAAAAVLWAEKWGRCLDALTAAGVMIMRKTADHPPSEPVKGHVEPAQGLIDRYALNGGAGVSVEEIGREIYDWLNETFGDEGMLPGGVQKFADEGDHIDAEMKHEARCEALAQRILSRLSPPSGAAEKPDFTERSPDGMTVWPDFVRKLLLDPQVIHLNMLRGGIAKLTAAQIGHLYRDGEAKAVIAEIIRQSPESAPSGEGKELVEAAKAALAQIEADECHHEDTQRGGAIWTICNGCGRKWADDEGGFKPYVEPGYITRLRAAIASAEGA